MADIANTTTTVVASSAAASAKPIIKPEFVDKANTGLSFMFSTRGLVIITIIISLIISTLYIVLCYLSNKYAQHRKSQLVSTSLSSPSSASPSVFDKLSTFRHRHDIMVTVPAALNGVDYAAVDQLQHIFVYRHGESIPGVLTELNPQSTPLVLLVINTGMVGAVPYGYLVPANNGVPVSVLDNTTLNNVSCNYSYACGSLSLQGVFTNEQLRIIGSYSGPLPRYNNGNTLLPNTTQTHRTISH